MKHENCDNKLSEKVNGLLKIRYCYECGQFEILPIECSHNFKPVRFITESGSTQIRKYCTLCFEITSQSEKEENYSGITLYNWKLSEYRTKLEDKKERDKLVFSDILEELKQIRIIQYGEQKISNISEYNEYLKSDHWKKLRERILIRDNYECQICFEPAEEVHHLTYQHRGEEYTFELVSLCVNCHAKYYHPEKTVHRKN